MVAAGHHRRHEARPKRGLPTRFGWICTLAQGEVDAYRIPDILAADWVLRAHGLAAFLIQARWLAVRGET